MDIGVGLDFTLGLSIDDQAELSREAARLGYTSIWTPEQVGEDAFQLCLYRWAASREVAPGGLTTGISVSPVGIRSVLGLSKAAGTLSKLSGGRFILGVGTGGAYMPGYRRQFGIRERSALTLMRDYITTMRALLAGETVTVESESVTLRDVRLTIDPPQHTPVHLGALGPEMVRLAGEVSDGVSLNWCSAEQIAWSRERIKEGAARSGRDPTEVKVVEYIRICVDDDVDVARRGLARATMGYAMGRGSTPRDRSLGYRAHFERMGFADDLAKLDMMRDRGAPAAEIADAFPEKLLLTVGYFGKPEGAAAHFHRLSEGLDIAIVRVVAARPGVDSTLAVMRACEPRRVLAG
jgi:5,10-methylenetetrahydromethanopterin reductase